MDQSERRDWYDAITVVQNATWLIQTDQSETWMETRLTHSNGPIKNLDGNEAALFKKTNQKPGWKRGSRDVWTRRHVMQVSHKRGVRQKTFSDIVGVHGLSKDTCYTVTVIYDTTNHKLITAFPTIWWKKAKRLERSEESWVHHWRRCFNDRWISLVTKKALHFILIVKSFYY